tara:strand:+ start:279 stop:791 length:513 start_codon:yes stop_codon:yes gene_type:complete
MDTALPIANVEMLMKLMKYINHVFAIVVDTSLWRDVVSASNPQLDNCVDLRHAANAKVMYALEVYRALLAVENNNMQAAATHLKNCVTIRPSVDETDGTLRSLAWENTPESPRRALHSFGSIGRPAACYQDDAERQRAVRGIRDTNGLITAFLVAALDLATVFVHEKACV